MKGDRYCLQSCNTAALVRVCLIVLEFFISVLAKPRVLVSVGLPRPHKGHVNNSGAVSTHRESTVSSGLLHQRKCWFYVIKWSQINPDLGFVHFSWCSAIYCLLLQISCNKYSVRYSMSLRVKLSYAPSTTNWGTRGVKSYLDFMPGLTSTTLSDTWTTRMVTSPDSGWGCRLR